MNPLSIDQTAAQQMINGYQIAAEPKAAGVSAKDQSFVTMLAEATGALLETESLSGIMGATSLAQPGGRVNGGSPSAMNLISLLVTSQQMLANGGISASPGQSNPASLSGAEVISKAEQYIGTPYLWGGSTPNGFDCSGFTQYVYSQMGLSLPRTSQEQATAGVPVQGLSSAQPGDLVFFAGSDGTPSSPGHVGIYVGNGQMLDAPYSGTTVQLQPVSTAGTVVAIRRVIPSVAGQGNILIGKANVPAQFVSAIYQAAGANGIPPSLLAALLSQESGFNPLALSPKGAVGIAQFMPSTASGLGVDPRNPVDSINGAAKAISSYVGLFGSYGDALAAYNAGPGAVTKYGGIPPYPETQAYVSKILSMAGLGSAKGVNI